MKKKILILLFSVITATVLVSGATFAWFTAADEPIVNEFTAGTVNITADYSTGFAKVMDENWNPGDQTDLNLDIINTGTKSTFLRAKFDKLWMPSMLRVLVVYTGKTVQLLAVEWDSTCKGFTVDEGPLATGDLYVGYPSSEAYINGTFSNLSNEDWITNGTYSSWCLDLWESIDKGVSYSVQIYDPLCNPNWYEEIDSKLIWENIPFEKIVYIINGNFLNKGYSSEDMQDAIWYYTNPDSTRPLSLEASEIVTETEENWELSPNNVLIDLGEDWVLGSDGYYYYKHAIPGTYSEAELEERTVVFDAKAVLSGALTGNDYQGKVFSMTTYFEAIQSSNNAIDDAWPANPLNLD